MPGKVTLSLGRCTLFLGGFSLNWKQILIGLIHSRTVFSVSMDMNENLQLEGLHKKSSVESRMKY